MSKGWIKIHRKILESPSLKNPNYLAVWMYLLLNAVHSDYDVSFGGRRVTLKPGQLTCGANQIAVQMGVSRSCVERAIARFKTEEQIEVQGSNKCSLITVKNWEFYQKTEEQNEEPARSKRGASEEQARTKEEYNNEKNEKKPPIATHVAEGKKKDKDDEVPMALPEFYEWTKKSPQRAIRVIGEWADTIKPNLTTKGQWRVFMSRHLRAAQDVAKFSDEQIENAYSKITELQKKSDFTPTLETLKKFLTN